MYNPPPTLREYVMFLDQTFASLMKKGQIIVMTISFVVPNPPAFLKEIENEKIDELYLRYTQTKILDEMERLAKKDLLDLCNRHGIYISENDKNKIIQDIMIKTKGHYEQTVDEIKMLFES